MRSVNEVKLLGNLGREPEVSYTPSGTCVAKLSIATTERFKSRDGEWTDRTEWHRVTVWGKIAEACSQFLKKGRQVFVTGKLQTHSWEKGGEKHYRLDIIASDVIFLGAPGRPDQQAQTVPATHPAAADGLGITDEDVPF